MPSLLLAHAFSTQQTLGIGRRHPPSFFSHTNRHDVVFVFIDRVEDRGGGEKGNFMLSASPAKENADLRLLHDELTLKQSALSSQHSAEEIAVNAKIAKD
jgi:hypothetical protein